MRGSLLRAGWRTLLPAARRLATILAVNEARRRCDVIDLEDGPHWLHRDIGLRDGRTTAEEMRRPRNWPDGR